MNKLIKLALGMIASLAVSSSAIAQCPDDNTFSGQDITVPGCPGSTTFNLDAGQSAVVNVIQNNVYSWSTCGSACDTYISLSDGAGTSYVFNDDGANCAPGSEILLWQAPFTGSMIFNLDGAGCANTGCTSVPILFECVTPPAFTDCDQAVTLPVNTTCAFQTFDNTNATASGNIPPASCPGYAGGDVFFNFTMPATGGAFIDFAPGSMTDAVMAIYPVNCAAMTNPDMCVDDDADPMPSGNVTYPPGTQLWIRVWGYNNQQGTFDICITEAPAIITASDCGEAVQVCDNDGFTIDPNGIGAINEIPAIGSYGNPSSQGAFGFPFPETNPGGNQNQGCLRIGESNSTWMMITLGTSGVIEMTFGGNGAQAGYYDWIMYPYDANSCTDIPNNLVAPVRCNWNGVSTGGTGLAYANNLPAGGDPSNYEPPLNAVCGDQFIICFSNYSSASTSVPVEFGGTAVVSCGNTVVISANDGEYCQGGNTALTATGATTYSWAPATGLSSTTGGTVTASPATTQSYTVTGTVGCLTDEYIVTVTVHPNPVLTNSYTDPATGLDVFADPTICNGECVNINAYGSANGYTWSPGTGLSSTTDMTVTACPTGTSTYVVNGTSGFGCPGSTTITVNVVDPPTPSVTSTTICEGFSGTLTASGATTYSWTPTATVAPTTGANVTVDPTSTTVYTVAAQGDPVCPVVNITTTVVVNSVSALIAGPIGAQCLTGNSFSFDGSGSTATSGPVTSWNWAFGDGQTGTGATPTITYLTEGVFTVTLTASDGTCVDNITTTVSVFAEPTATLTSPNPNCFDTNAEITVTGAGGTPGYSYVWSEASTGAGATNTINGLPDGLYTVTITDANSCTGIQSLSVTQPPAITLTQVCTDITAPNADDGISTVTAAGGQSGYTYNWNTAATSQTINGLTAGTYTVTVTDVNGCTAVSSCPIIEPNCTVTFASTVTDALCFGGSDGSATVEMVGGVDPITYVWSNAGSNATENGLPAGSINITITDLNACLITGSVAIGQPSALVISVTSADILCNGDANGTTDVTMSGGTPPYDYLWNSGATAEDLTGLSGGIITVTVTDANTCTTTGTATILEPTSLVGSTSVTNVTCNTGADGSINLTPSGGTTGYTYLWSNTTTTEDLSGVTAGTYDVSITDANNCTFIVNSVITEPTPIVLTTTTVDANCGQADGSAIAGASGSNSGFTYSWSNTINNASNPNLQPAIYTVTATDALGCTAITTATVNNIAGGTISVVVDNNITCFGDCDGQASATLTGGATPYTYLWTSGATTSTAQSLCVGPYTVTITDATNCIVIETITVTEPTQIVGFLTGTNVSCYGECDGTATTNFSGGTAPLTYLWADGQTSLTAITLCADTAFVTVSDVNGCTALDSIKIQSPAQISITTSSTQSNCGAADGSATVDEVIGGVSTYTYSWPSGGTVATEANLVAASYDVTVTDLTGCTMIQTAIVSDLGGGTVTLVVDNNVSCFDGNDGQASATMSGGTAPYTYIWSSSSNTGTIETGLSVGAFSLTVNDAVGCATIASDVVTEPTLLSVNVLATDVSCFGGSDGTASATGAGGTTNYSYLWSNSATTTNLTGLQQSTYNVTITDANGCTSIASDSVSQPTILASSIVGTDATCNGFTDGTSTLTMFGGTSGYSYLWSDATTNQNLSNAGAGVYLVTITDAAMCTTINIITISEPTVTTVVIAATNDVSCNGLCDGNATASASGGTPPFSYLWSNAQTNPLAINLCAGTINVTATDNSGCPTSTSAMITEPNALVGLATSTNINCFGAQDGTISISVNGGTTGYTYLWNNAVATASQTGLAANTYTVTVTDANLCTIIDVVNVSEPTELLLSNSSTQSTCGVNDGSASVTIVSGDAPFTYLWSTNAGSQTTPTAGNLFSGNYQVTVFDANLCEAIDYIGVTDLGAPTASIITVTDVSCFGGSDGFAQVSVAGGIPPFTYLWNDPATQTTSSATGLPEGTWSATMEDANGCIASINVMVNQPSLLVSSISNFVDVSCFGYADGSATILAAGGTPPYTYQWNDLASQQTATANGLLPGVYTASSIDANNCVTLVNVTISEPPQIILTNSTTAAFCQTPTGEACVIIANGVAPYTYNWGNGQVDSCASALIPANYTITVTDIVGCTATNTATVADIPPGIATISNFTNASCNGDCDGTATVSMGAATPPYTYLWSNGSTNITATGLCPTIYNVTVSDLNTCAAVTSVTITDPPLLTATTTPAAAACNGSNEGFASAIPTGGTAPYTYLWDNNTLAQTAVTAIDLYAGTYFVTVTDNQGCEIVTSAIIIEPSAILTDTTIVSSNCGQADGGACVIPSGATPPYTYLWQTMETTDCISNVVAGSYNVTITDTRGCTHITSAIINDIAGPTASITDTTMVSCFGLSDGTATVDMISGTGAFMTQWFDNFGIAIPGQVSNQATNLNAGNYSVDIIDAVGCVASAVIEITEPDILTNNPNLSDPSCFGYCDGTAGAAVGGGTTPYAYSWTGTASFTNQVNGLCSGAYILNITDDHGCVDFVNFNLVEPQEILGTITVTDVICNNVCNGTATMIPTNGIGNIVYQWDDTQSTPTAIGLCDGNYSVTATDANGCSIIRSTVINQPSAVASSIIAYGNVSCAGLCDGYAEASASGGTPGYVFSWTGGQIGSLAPGLCFGQYIVTVTDAVGCTATSAQIIAQPTPVTATIVSSTNVLCNGDNSGNAVVAGGGGVGNYSYQWDFATNFQASATANNLYASGAGGYFVTVTDANGCTANTSVIISQPTQFGMNMNSINSHCGQNDGQICVTMYGGVVPYTYQWNDPFTQTDACADFISAGCYTVIVTDNNGCISDSTICINDIAGPIVNLLSYQDVSCAGAMDGIVNVNVTNGTPPYVSLQWFNPAPMPQFDDASSVLFVPGNTTYCVEVTDNAGCIATYCQFIDEPSAVVSFVTAFTNVTCFGGNNAMANVTAGGGTPGFNYQWNTSPAQTTTQATTLSAGPYTVIVTDANSCTSSASVTISEPTLLQVSDITSGALCHGVCDGDATLTSTGATPPYIYTWSPSMGSGAQGTNLCFGNYFITITDAHGCTATDNFNISEPDTLLVTSSSDASYCTEANGQAQIVAAGGTPAYNYYWNTNPTQNTAQAVGLMAGNYGAQVTDANNCVYNLTVPITDQPGPMITSIDFVLPDCYNSPTGTACVNVTGGTPPLSYQWNDIIGQITDCATGLYARTYTVTVTDINGCTDVMSGLLGQPNQLNATGIGDTVLCEGQSSIIWGVAQGGTTPYQSITWNNASLVGYGPHTVAPTILTDYCFTIVDANGCSSSDCITIAVRTPLQIFGPEDTTICFESEANFCVTGFGGTDISNYVFTWADGPIDTDTSTSCRTVSPTDTTTYRVILSDGCSIEDTAYITVNVLPLPPPYFSVLEQEGCPPFTAQFSGFTNSNEFPNATFYWEVDEDSTTYDGGAQTFDFVYENSGSYDVTLVVTSEWGCSRSITNANYITVYPEPVANFTANPTVLDLIQSEVYVNGEATIGSDSLAWDFGDTGTGDGITYQHVYSDTGHYPIVLTVVNDWGCKDTALVWVEVQSEFILYAPNAFTPNGDGDNDEWFPDGVGIDVDDFELLIYNRWGEIIFKSSNLNDKWDGIAHEKSGKKVAQTGVYVWLVIAHDFYGEEHRYMGHVTLLK